MNEVPMTDMEKRMHEYALLLDSKKGKDILRFNLQGQYKSFDGVLIVTANSTRHAQSLARGVLDYAGEQKHEYLRMEGYTNGTWILVDLNDIIIHIFKEEERHLYGIEHMWNVAALPYP